MILWRYLNHEVIKGMERTRSPKHLVSSRVDFCKRGVYSIHSNVFIYSIIGKNGGIIDNMETMKYMVIARKIEKLSSIYI